MKNIRSKIVALFSFVAFIAFTANSIAQMQLEWVQRYNGYGLDYDQANALALDDSGNVYVTGSTQYQGGFKCVTIKYSRAGVQQWLREYHIGFIDHNIGLDVAVDDNGNCYVAATTGLLRYDRNGNLVWARYDQADMQKVWVDSAGYIYSSGLGGEHVYFTTVKYDSLGVRHWRDYATNIGSGYRVHDLFLDQSRNVIVVGYKINAVTYSDYVTIKYSNSGVMQWWRFYNGLAAQQCDDMAYAGTSDKNENLYITGASMDGSGVFNCTTIKYGPSGDTVWIKRLFPPSGGYDIKIDSRGNICIASRCCGYNYVTKLDSSANMIWERTYRSGSAEVYLSRLVLDSADNIYTSGHFDTLSTHAYAASKYDSAGKKQYEVGYYYTPAGWNFPYDLAVDRRGSVYLTGRSNRSLCTVKFSEIPTGITPLTALPSDFKLHQNYPNPFNPTTTIKFDVRTSGNISLKVFDVLGREVEVIVNEYLKSGSYSVQFSGDNLPSGVYYYKLRAESFSETKRMLLVK
jgi:streptogramin lyase